MREQVVTREEALNKVLTETEDGLPLHFFSGMPCVEFEEACEKYPDLRKWMRGQTGLGPIGGKCYIYLWDYDNFLKGGKVVD